MLAPERGAERCKALRLHNGTIYRWTRPCYGICEGKPHLRIENRILPAGPTIVDEIANAAFWFGLLSGLSRVYPDIRRVMEFDTAQRELRRRRPTRPARPVRPGRGTSTFRPTS